MNTSLIFLGLIWFKSSVISLTSEVNKFPAHRASHCSVNFIKRDQSGVLIPINGWKMTELDATTALLSCQHSLAWTKISLNTLDEQEPLIESSGKSWLPNFSCTQKSRQLSHLQSYQSLLMQFFQCYLSAGQNYLELKWLSFQPFQWEFLVFLPGIETNGKAMVSD